MAGSCLLALALIGAQVSIEPLKLEGTPRVIESNSLLLAELPKTKPYDQEHCPHAA